MGDRISNVGGIHTVTRDPGYDRRQWRYRNDDGWPTLEINTVEGIQYCMKKMGLPPQQNPRPLTLKCSPEAQVVLLHEWDVQAVSGDERLIEVMDRKPSPIYLRRGCNHILCHNRKD